MSVFPYVCRVRRVLMGNLDKYHRLSQISNFTSKQRKRVVSDSFSIDRSGLISNHLVEVSDTSLTRENASPLTHDLKTYIKLRGPITIHDFMAQALNHSAHGYYQHKFEKIGTGGKFGYIV